MRHLLVAFVVFEIVMVLFCAIRATNDDGDSFLSRSNYFMDDMELSPSGARDEDENLSERERILQGMESRSASFMELDTRE